MNQSCKSAIAVFLNFAFLTNQIFADLPLVNFDTAEWIPFDNVGLGTQAAVRAHNENEAERILGVVGAALGLPPSREELMLLKKGDRRKVICAAIVRSRTAVGNDWLAERLAMGHPSYVSTLVQRIRRNEKEQKTLKKYDSI